MLQNPGQKRFPYHHTSAHHPKDSLQKLISLPCNNGFVRTGTGSDALAELASPAAQTEGRYTSPSIQPFLHVVGIN